jgi:hypothetical protein
MSFKEIDRSAKTTATSTLPGARGREKRGTHGNTSKSGASTPLWIGIVLGIAILAGVIAYQTLPESREKLEERAGTMVTEILAGNESFSSFFTVQGVSDCLLVNTDENTYSGSLHALCTWKDPSLKGKMRSLFIEAAGSDGGVKVAVVEEFVRQLVDPMKFKFDVEMVYDGSRCSVSCTVADKQPTPAGKVVLALLGLGEDNWDD